MTCGASGRLIRLHNRINQNLLNVIAGTARFHPKFNSHCGYQKLYDFGIVKYFYLNIIRTHIAT